MVLIQSLGYAAPFDKRGNIVLLLCIYHNLPGSLICMGRRLVPLSNQEGMFCLIGMYFTLRKPWKVQSNILLVEHLVNNVTFIPRPMPRVIDFGEGVITGIVTDQRFGYLVDRRIHLSIVRAKSICHAMFALYLNSRNGMAVKTKTGT